MKKALETIKLMEVTLIIGKSFDTVSEKKMFCAMDYITVHDGVQIIGWSERDLEVKVVGTEAKS